VKAALKTIGDWEKGVRIPLESAMQTSMQVMGRTGEQTTKATLIFMAQSARAITPTAPKNRKVSANPGFKNLLRKDQYGPLANSGRNMKPYFKYVATKYTQKAGGGMREVYANEKEPLKPIRNRGLAKASWFWPLKLVGGPSGTTTFTDKRGVTSAGPIQERAGDVVYRGYQLTNALSYITRIMPSGWQSTVEQKAANRLLGQAREKLRRDFVNSMKRAQRVGVATITRALR